MPKSPETEPETADAKAWTIPGEVMNRIIYDVAGEIPPENSHLEYSEEMLDFRDRIVAEWEAWEAEHPGSELYAPEDLPSANIPV